jgi:hypothetical protein
MGSEASEAATLPGVPSEAPTLNIRDSVSTQNATALKMAEQVNRARELEQFRSDLRRDNDAVQYALAAIDSLLESVHLQVAELNESFPDIGIEYLNKGDRQVAVVSSGYGVKISWQQPYRNSLSESRLVIVDYRRGRSASDEREFTKTVCDFNVNDGFEPGWMDRKRFIKTNDLAQECVNRLMTLLHDRPEADQISKDPIYLSEKDVRQAEGVNRKTPSGVFHMLRFNMPVSEKSNSMVEGDEVRFRGFNYVVYKKQELRSPEVSEDCDQFWLSPK